MLHNLDEVPTLALMVEKLEADVAQYAYRLNASKAQLEATKAKLKLAKAKPK